MLGASLSSTRSIVSSCAIAEVVHHLSGEPSVVEEPPSDGVGPEERGLRAERP
jgi:hypothetical protein